MKKALSIAGLAFAFGLMLTGAGCTNRLEGTWISEQPVNGSTIEVEFTKTRIIGTGERINPSDSSKKSTGKVIVDYNVKKEENGVHTVSIDNPEVNIIGNLADDKQQVTWQDEGKKYLNDHDEYVITVAADGKTMIVATDDMGQIAFRRK